MFLPLGGPRLGASALPLRPDNTSGLVGWWTFDGNAANDVSGNGHTLAVQSAVKFQPSPFGNALVANGAATGTATSSATTIFAPPSLTYMCWAKPADYAAFRSLMGGNSGYPTLLFAQSTGIPNFAYFGQSEAAGTVGPPLNQWVHMAGTYNNATSLWCVYMNGVLAGSFTVARTFNSQVFYIGGSATLFATGLIADARVYNRPLQASEIFAIYATALSKANRLGDGELPALFSPGGTTHNQTVSPSTSSTVGLTKRAGAIRSITTSSTLTALKQARAIRAITSASTLGLAKRAGAIRSITTSSTVSALKAVAKTLRASTAGVVAVTAHAPQHLLLTITIASSSTVAMVKYAARTLGISTASAVTVIASSVLVALASKIRRAMLTLVGRQAGMLLSGCMSQLELAGRKSQLELTGMSTTIDGVFHAGETWIINGLTRDEDGAPIDLTGATVQLRIVNGSVIVLDLATPTGGGVVVAPTAGTYQFLITPTMQFAANMTLTAYEYELRVLLGDGSISVQNTGEITVKPSRFVA